MDPMRVGSSRMARHLTGWDAGDGPLHAQLAAAIRGQVETGMLPQGAILPSQRELARVLAVSRTTASTAYEALRSEGWLASRHGAGTWVRTNRRRTGPDWHGDRLGSYATPELPLDLSSGALAASPLMSKVLRSSWTTELRRHLVLDRFVPWGLGYVREAVAQYYTETAVPTNDQQILLTNGSHHALALVAECLLEPGDVVLVEDPTYRGALDIFARRGAQVLGIPVDAEGIDPGILDRAIRKHKARFLYVLPTAHCVTGTSWSHNRRQRVADIISATGTLVIDDGSTADLHAGEHPGYIASLLPAQQSITLGSLTKLFWAGIRVGWIRGPRQLLQAALEVRLTSDLSGSLPSQVLTAACLPLAEQARELRRHELDHARETTSELLVTHLPGWTTEPGRGGACVWVDTHRDTAALASRLRREQIVVIPGTQFSPSDNWRTHIRLPLGRLSDLEDAIARIAVTEVVREAEQNGPSQSRV